MENLTSKALKVIASDHGIKGYWSKRKADLIYALRDIEADILDKPLPEVKNYKCPHGKVKYICKDCGSPQICFHNKKNQCRECKGSQICYHDHRKYQCKECGGSQICEHKNLSCGVKTAKTLKYANTEYRSHIV